MVLKITRDELPVEQGVYGGCLLCPLYPLLISIEEGCGSVPGVGGGGEGGTPGNSQLGCAARFSKF